MHKDTLALEQSLQEYLNDDRLSKDSMLIEQFQTQFDSLWETFA